jgi:hypothetical protein
MRHVMILAISAVTVFLTSVAVSIFPASAGLLNFNLGSCAQVTEPCTVNTDTGLSVLDFVNGGLDLRTVGAIGNTPANLFVKNTGIGDVGLGLFAGPLNEIGPGETVTLDLSKLAQAGFNSGTVTIESLDSGEVGLVTDELGAHAIVENGSSLTNSIPVSFSTASPDVTVTAVNGSVLAAGDLEITVPEVSTTLLFLTGILGFILLKESGRKNRRRM